MSKLDELISELCPDGVEYIAIGDVVKYEQPTKYIVNSIEYNDNFTIPVLTAGQSFILGYTNETEGIYNASKENPVIIFDDFTGAFKWVDFPFKVKSSAMKILIADESKIMIRYVFHVMGRIGFVSDEHKRLWISKYSAIRIPLPPMQIQSEIVRILDKFTELTMELITELTARKKQYEYYRNRLLEHTKNNCSMVAISELGKWSGGKTPSTANKEYWENGTIPWISSKDMKTSTLEDTEDHLTDKALEDGGMKLFPEGIVAIVIRSGILKHTFPIAYVPFRTTINQDVKALVVKDGISSRYVFYAMQAYAEDIRKSTKKQGGTVDSLDFQRLLAYKIPIPALEVQNRLVDVLDNFESICSDLNIGLPAEIELRKKQYEFYRDALLTFAETGNIIAQTDRQTDDISLIKLIQYVFGNIMLPLYKVANLFRGEYITRKNTNTGTIPVILGGQEPAYYINKYNHDGEVVVVSRSGASAGFVSYWNQKVFITDGFGYEGKSELITTKYLYYALKSIETDLNGMKRGAGVPHISGEILGRVKLFIPSILEQQRIVNILEHFDTLCNDLSLGLPAEIEARQKQYEYYRNKLLSF